MTVESFRLPDVGEGVAEGELVRWLVAPGDRVEEDQPIAEVETDKALVEIPSRYDGVVKELRAEEGEMVPVGEVIVTFEVDSADGDAAEATTAAADAEAETSGAEGAEAAEGEREATTADETAETADETAERDSATTGGRVFAAPSTRRLARELGVALGRVEGSGVGGRVTEADVRAAAERESEATEDESAETEDGDGAEREDGESEAPSPRSVDVEAGEPAVRRVDEGEDAETGVRRESSAAVEAATEAATAVSETTERREKTLAAPATRELARELGVDLDAVPTDESRDGVPFVTPAMVHEFAERRRQDAGAAASEAAEADATAEAEGDESAANAEGDEGAANAEGDEGAANAEGATKAEGEKPTRAEPGPGDRIPYRGIRRTIGQQMERSKYTAPHVTHHDDVDATALVSMREDLREYAAAEGVHLTYLPFVMKAVVEALAEFPVVNASLDEEAEEIVLHDEYNVGVATATDAGLLVPVVDGVDDRDLLDLAATTNERVERARERSISRSEMQGGTFTVTNVGAIGGEYATPIINYPEVAILAVGELKERPRVVDGEVVARHTLPLSLSVDHRVVDGAVAARFTNRVTEYLAHPARLLVG
ncbi:MAG: dihydrolipoamide acetyltransferase family protein [Haloplanus sp.]